MVHADDAIVIRTFLTRQEAEMARGFLEAKGIAAMVISDDCGSQDPALQFVNGAKLLVERSKADEAASALEAEGA